MEKIYYCENCGGVMDFDPASQMLKCPNCDTHIEIFNDNSLVIEHPLTLHDLHTVRADEKTSHTMECRGCGAKIEVDATSTATECPYCGSNYVLASKQEDAIVPDGIVPFQIDKHKASEIFHQWVKTRHMAPGRLKQLYQKDKIQGIYLPYWTFDAMTHTRYTAMGGRHRQEKRKNSDGKEETVIVTDWYPTSGQISHFFDDILVPASQKLDGHILDCVDVFRTKETASYAPEYMSGYSAECFTVDLQPAHETAVLQMENELKAMARQEVLCRYDEVSNICIFPSFERESYKHILLPIYSTAYKYRDKIYHVLINGQTGNIDGEYPKSAAKIILIIAVIVLLVLFVYYWLNQ